jgi:hypothetical protein
MAIQISFQPTLFIFLGTSAGQIGWRLKELMHRSFGDVPVLRFLWIDTDWSIDSLAKPWFKTEDRINIGGFDPATVAKNIKNYPYIVPWWPEGTKIQPGVMASGTSHQMRLAGRLALFRMFNDRDKGPAMIDTLRSATDALSQIDNIRRTENKSTDKIKYSVESEFMVVLVFSPCGGTGSSIAFDVAYLCRHLLSQHTPTIISVNILPTVFFKAATAESQAQKEKMQANAYAWFKEDNYLTENPYWRVDYPELETVEVAGPPFNYRFLIDIGNQAGYSLDNFNDVCQMIAQALFLYTGSSIAGDVRGRQAIVAGLSDSFLGKRKAYSSLAAATLRFPKDRILEYCTHNLAKSLLEDGFMSIQKKEISNTREAIGGKIDSADLLDITVSAMITHLKLRDSDLLSSLVEGNQVKMANEPPIKKADTVAAALLSIDDQEEQNKITRKNNSDKIKKTANTLLQQITIGLDHEITKIATMQGVKHAQNVLDQLLVKMPDGFIEPNVTSFDGLRKRIRQQGMTDGDLKTAKENFSVKRKALYSLDDGFEDKVERLINMRGWKKKFALYKNDCLVSMREINQASIQLDAQEQADNIYVRIADDVEKLKSRLNRLANAIEKLATEMGDAAVKVAKKSKTHGLEYEFLREVPVDFLAYYKDKVRNIDLRSSFIAMVPAHAMESFNALENWVNDDLSNEVITHAGGFFQQDLEDTSLLNVLREIAEKDGKDPQEVIRNFMDGTIRFCHPFWQYDQNVGLHGLDGLSIIGVEDNSSPLIPDTYRSDPMYQIKATRMRDRIDVLRMRHALPAFLLQGMSVYKSYYEKKRKGFDPLHILPDMEFAPDIMPEEGQRNREMFAIGLVFNYIVQIGSWYYYDSEKVYLNHNITPSKKFRLAQGRENAEDKFSLRDEWVQNVETMVEADVRQMGNEAAIKKLEKCIESHLASIAKMTSEDTLRTQFEKEISAFRNMARKLGKVN